MVSDFGNICFSGKLRPSQVASSGIIRKELENDSKELLIVAPQVQERPFLDCLFGLIWSGYQLWS